MAVADLPPYHQPPVCLTREVSRYVSWLTVRRGVQVSMPELRETNNDFPKFPTASMLSGTQASAATYLSSSGWVVYLTPTVRRMVCQQVPTRGNSDPEGTATIFHELGHQFNMEEGTPHLLVETVSRDWATEYINRRWQTGRWIITVMATDIPGIESGVASLRRTSSKLTLRGWVGGKAMLLRQSWLLGACKIGEVC